jgi:hypothetical protein
MDRRTFIKISGIVTAVSVTPWLSGCTSNSQWTSGLALPETLGTLCGKEELITIGQAYRAAYPDEENQSTLEAQILGEHTPVSVNTIAEFIRNKITSEFSSHNIVVVKGWVLARTEARQAALFSLLNP